MLLKKETTIKGLLYKFYIKRIDESIKEQYYFEASWLASALIEDRVTSLLSQTGGNKILNAKKNKDNYKPVRTLGRKIKELKKRLLLDELLRKRIKPEIIEQLTTWTDSRNVLMHSMADGGLTLSEVQSKIEYLAKSGQLISQKMAAESRLIKKKKKNVNLRLSGKK
jgi:hypothetical protein